MNIGYRWHLVLCVLCFVTLAACGTNPAERNNAGNNYTRAGNYDAAVRAYQAAQVAEPDNGILYFNSARALAAGDRINDAQAALRQAIERGDPALIAAAHYNLGNLHFDNGDYQQAIDAYKATLRQQPGNDDARYNLELALTYLDRATPTAIEMQTNPENQPLQPTTTPSPNPIGQDEPSPTPTPPQETTPPPITPLDEFEEEDEAGVDSDEPPKEGPSKQGALDVDSASTIMQFVEAQQENLSIFRNNPATLEPNQQLERDW